MKKVLLSLALWSCSQMAMGQVVLSGRVKDASTNEALPSASVVIENLAIATSTNAEGLFSFNKLRKGLALITVSYVGFSTQSQEIALPYEGVLEIALQPESKLVNEVVVSATRASEKTATTFSTIKKAEIEQKNLGQDVPYLLDQIPSVVVSSDAGAGVGYTGIRIRGSDATRINVTVNGVPINDAESQGTFWVNMPDLASSAQDIQVQRGVGTSTNGSGAFGASINIQTDQIPQKAYAGTANSFGSFNTRKHTVKAGTGLINGHYFLDMRLSQIASDGYIDRASSDLKSYYLSGGYIDEKNMLKAVVFGGKERTYQAWYGVDEATLQSARTTNFAGYKADGTFYDDQTDNYQQDHHQLHYSRFISPQWELNTALHYTYGRGYYEEYNVGDSLGSYRLGPVSIGDSTIYYADLVRQLWLDNDFYGATWAINYTPNNRLRSTLGGSINQYDGRHFGKVIWAQVQTGNDPNDHYYNHLSKKTDFTIYAKTYYNFLENMTGFVDLQYRKVHYETNGDRNRSLAIVDDLQFFNPKAGITYQVSPFERVYASVALANREGNRNDYTDNEEKPIPERLYDVEFGFVRSNKNFNIETVGYLMYYVNQLVLTGQLNDVGAYIRSNAGESYRAGLEITSSYRANSWALISLNAALSKNVVKSFAQENGAGELIEYTNTDISFSPWLIGGANLTILPTDGMQVSLNGKYVGKQYLDNTSNNNSALDGYFLLGAQAQYILKPTWMNEIGFNLAINNLLNKMYVANGASYGEGANYYYPQAGINFLVGITLNF